MSNLLNPISLQYQNGNIVTPKQDEDHISCLVFVGLAEPTGWAVNASGLTEPRKYTSVQDAVASGIDGTTGTELFLYHIKEFFRQAPNSTLYFMVQNVLASTDAYSYAQAQCQGKIRLFGVYLADRYSTCSVYLNDLSTFMNGLQSTVTDAFSLIQPRYESNDTLPQSLYPNNYTHIALLASADGNADGANLASSLGYYVGSIGAALGAVSASAVHESCGWVEKRNLSKGNKLELDMPLVSVFPFKDNQSMASSFLGERHLVFLKYPGSNGTFIRFDHNLVEPTGTDLNSIKRVRTQNKVRILANEALLPFVNAPQYTNPANGTISPASIEYIRSRVEEMIKVNMLDKGQLTAFQAQIDPNQNILGTGTLNVLLKMIPVGSSETIVATLSYVANI